MRRIILASHGSLAEGMLSAVKMILGDHYCIHGYGLDKYETIQALLEAVQKEIDGASGDEIFVVCDIKSGSVHHAMIQLLKREEDIKIISGMNLGMVLELCTSQLNTRDPGILQRILETGKNDIFFLDKAAIQSLKEGKEGDSLW